MNNSHKSFKELAAIARKKTPYFVQGAILDFTEDVVSRMKARELTKSELAQKLNTSPAYVTKLLSGVTNFTLETMVKVAIAVDAELRVHLQPKGSISQWVDVLDISADVRQGSELIELKPDAQPIRNSAANEELALAA